MPDLEVDFYSLLLYVTSGRHNKQIGRETKSTLACFTKDAKCMTLSILETSLPMQRSHDTLALDISAQNWCAKQT